MQLSMWSLCFRTFILSGEKEVSWKRGSNFLRNNIYSFVPFVHTLDRCLDGAMSSTLFVEGTSQKLAMLFNFPAFYSSQTGTALVFLSKLPPLLPVSLSVTLPFGRCLVEQASCTEGPKGKFKRVFPLCSQGYALQQMGIINTLLLLFFCFRVFVVGGGGGKLGLSVIR